MKKKILIGAAIAVAAIVLIIALCLIFKADPILTQPMQEVSGVTITLNPWDAPENEFDEDGRIIVKFPQKADMYTMHSEISKIKRCRNIRYSDAMEFNTPYEVVITYKDGSTERIFAAEDAQKGRIYRCLNPEAPTENQKFVTGICVDLPAYIDISTH